MTYMQLAKELAGQGYTKEEFAAVLKELTGEDYYAADPSTYIEGDFTTGMEEGTTPLQSGPPMEEAGQRSVTAERIEPRLQSVNPTFDLPAVMQMQQEEERRRVEEWRARQIAAEEPSPTEFTYPSANVDPATGEPRSVMTRREIATYPTHMQPYLLERFGYQTVDPGVRPMSTQELAAASGRPPETLDYPEEYAHTLAATEALGQDPESVYREETAPEPEPEPMTPAMPMRYNIPHPATFEGPAKPSLEGELPSTLAEYMEGKRLIAGEIRDEPEPMPSAVADYMEGKRLVAGRLEDIPSADYRGEDYVTRLDEPAPASVMAPIAEMKRKGEIREEFYEKAERPPVGPRDLLKAALDPFDFAGMVMDNKSLEVWSEAMWERFIQLFEVPVEKAIEGDLRLQRLLRPEEWDSDDDFGVFLPGMYGDNKLTAGDRRNLERLWDIQDAEVMEAIDETMVSTEAKAALYPILTNARKSVGNLANGLWDMGLSIVGGNIPDAVWREMDSSERKRMLEEQAHEAIDEMFGKGMASFVITVLANPGAAVEVFPAEISFIAYRPMKAMARPAGRKFVESMDLFLEWQGAKGPRRAAVATGIKRAASATQRAFADPAAHYTKGGEEFLQKAGPEAILAEEAITEGFDVVARSVAEETAAGRPPEVIETPLRPRYEGGGPVRPVADVPSPKHPTTFTARATAGEPLVRKADIAAQLKEWRGHEAWLLEQPEGTTLTSSGYREFVAPGEVPMASRPMKGFAPEARIGLTLEQVRAEIWKLEALLEERAPLTVLPEAEVLPLGAAERTTIPEPVRVAERKRLADPTAEEALSSAEGMIAEIEGVQVWEGPIAALREVKEQVRLADLELAELRQSTTERFTNRMIDELETVRGALVEYADNILQDIASEGDAALMKGAKEVMGSEASPQVPSSAWAWDRYEGRTADVAAAKARTPSKTDPVEAVRAAIEELQARRPEPTPEAPTPRDTIWAHQRRAAALADGPTGSGGTVSFHVSAKGGMRAAAGKRKVSTEALEAGVLDSVAGLSETSWPHTPKRQLGYEFEVHTVPISSQTGGSLGKSRKVATAKRDPKPTILPDEAMGMIRDLTEIFGEEGAILRGIVTEEGLAQQVIAAVDIELVNQFSSPKGRATVVETVVETANQSFWGGKMPRKVKKDMAKTVADTLEDAAGRHRGEGGTSSVFNPLFELQGPDGRIVTVNGLRALAKKQKADPVFRAKIQKEALDYVSRRIGAQAKARGVQDGVMSAIVRDSEIVGKTAYAMSSAADRATMRAQALKGSKEVQKHTSLKNELNNAKAKTGKERDTAKIDSLTKKLDEMEGTTTTPGVVDTYLNGLIDKYRRTGDMPSTWLFGDALEHAWNRLQTSRPGAPLSGLWMLREHLRPRNATKVFGSGLTADQALMSSYFGFTKPSAQAQAAFRRAAAKPFTDITTAMPDRWMSKPLYKVSELMARDAGVLPAMGWLKGIEKYWRAVKLGKVAGNPGSHVMALGANTIVQMQRRGDMFIAAKAAGSLVDYMRFKAGLKTLVDPQIYRSLEHSGRISGSMVKGEIDANMRRWLEDPEFATRDWAGDFMTAGIGRRVYDWWDTMFKIEDGVNQWHRRMKEWDSLPAGTAKNPIEYHFPVGRSLEIKAQKINGKMVVDGRVLTDAQFRHMMGRAAMEPGARWAVDFKVVPLLAIFKRNFPLLDMMLSDFSTWRIVTDTFPFFKDGIWGEIMLGATPRGYVSHLPLRLKRAGEMATTNMLRTMTTAALSQRVSGEDHQMMRAMLNRYGAASPVYSISATADPRVFSVMNGTSFSVHESVERWLRTAEALAYTAPSRGHYGETIQEWLGFVKPDATIELPGAKRGDEPDTEMMLLLSDDEMAKLSPAKRRHIEASKAYWIDNAKTGGMGRKASMGLFYMEGNIYINMFLDFLFETRKEAEMGPKLAVADTLIRSLAPRWAAAAMYYGLETKREGDIEKYRDAMEVLQKEEDRIEAIPEDERTQKERDSLKRILDPARRKDLQTKYLSFAKDVEALTREEYRAEAILGALDPSLAEGPLRRAAQRTLHSPVFVAAWHRFNTDPKSKRKVKEREGMKAVGFQFKGTAINGLIDRATRQFGRGAADAEAIHRTATRAGDRPVFEGSTAHEYAYEVGEKIKSLTQLYREILLEEAEGMQGRWDEMFGKLELKAQQKGQEDAPFGLDAASIPTDPASPDREIPLEGWTKEPDIRKRFEKPEQYYPF